jgi:2-polyprenyl-3-methyl-5-hydroxy-6-metoxy-1,4-benzoquinol methylase
MIRKLIRTAVGWLDNQWLWQGSRFLLDATFGLYRKRFAALKDWGVLDGGPSVLDIGCGIGQYATLTTGTYLGIDLNDRYVQFARRRYPQGNKAFRCVDVTTLWQEQQTFDIVLMVDFLHHIPDAACVEILQKAGKLANGHVASFEPLKTQSNPLGRWIVNHDRGQYMRPLDELNGLFAAAGLSITRTAELRIGPITTRANLCSSDRGVLPQTRSQRRAA